MDPRIVIFGKTPLLARNIGRVVGAGGVAPVVASSVEEIERLLSNGSASCLCVGVDELPPLLPFLEAHPAIRLMLLSGASLDGLMDTLARYPQIEHVFGLRYPDAPPRSWELLAAVRRCTGSAAAPLGGALDWGASQFTRKPACTDDRDRVVEEVVAFARPFGGDRVASVLGEVAHELLMNAMYDAPVDPAGRPLYAADRRTVIKLSPAQQPTFLCGCDGTRFLLAIEDPFGLLKRSHVFGGLQRAVSSGTLDRSGGGAGLGFMVIYRAAHLLFFDVLPRVCTRVSAVLELDVPPRETRALPRSIHFYSQEP